MKNTFTKLLSLVLVAVFCLGTLASCGGGKKDDGENPILVGNTAATTGAMAGIGGPFKLGLESAFNAYNKAGGFNGRPVKLKHYDDGGETGNASTLLGDLIHTDNVFAIVGHFGSYAVDATLETLIDEEVPMIYAAAGNNELFNESADTLGERGIFPVQPLNEPEGRMLILRAFAPIDKGGLGATKVGVIYNSNEASQALYRGIQKEMANLTEEQRNNILPQEVNTSDYSTAINKLKADGYDTVIVTVIGDDFYNVLTTMANVNYRCNVLTTYNNSSAAKFNDANNKLQSQYESVFQTVNLFAQAWLDITASDYVYKKPDEPLYNAYKALALVYQKDENGKNVEVGFPGFTEEYWEVAEDIYDYVSTVDPAQAFAMSCDAYALAGYIAGDLFCQALEELEKSEKELTRENLIDILESKEYKIAMANTLSFANGMRSGVQHFALTCIYDAYNIDPTKYSHGASSATVDGLKSIEEYRALLQK